MATAPTRVDSTTNDKYLDEKVEFTDDNSHEASVQALEQEKKGTSGYVPTDSEKLLDKRINRKLDLILLPICAINFLLCGIDKGNLGNAATTTFAQDVGLRPDDISDAVSILSVTFVTLQPFGVALGRRIGVTYWIPLIMILWGTCTAAHAAIHNRASLFALRLLLGAFEASFFPSTVYYLSTMYTRYDLGFRLGLFAGCYSIASAFSGLIAYGCFHIKNDALHGWQWLFVLEGAVTVAFAFVTFAVLPRNNHRIWFFNGEEQAHLVERMERDIAAHTSEAETSGKTMAWRDVRDAFYSWEKIVIIIGNIFATLPVSAFGVFAPLVVKGMGYKSVDANLMSVPPFVVGAVLLWCFLYSSDRFRERSGHTCIAMTIAIIGLAVMYGAKDNKLRYGFLHVCLGGAFVGGPTILAWLAGNTPVTSTRALIIGINGYSNIAGVIAGQLFKPRYAPTYAFPLRVTMILMSVGICIFLSMRGYLMWRNKQRRAIIAKMTPQEIEAERLSLDRRGDQKVTFIYGL